MITTGDVVLRAPREDDLEALTAVRNDVEVQALLLAMPRPSSTSRVRDWLLRMSDDPKKLFFIVAERMEDRAVGFVQLTDLDFIHGTSELGICLTSAARGRGLGYAAIAGIEAYANSTFRIRKVVLRSLSTNAPAIRLYEKSGYTRVGVLRRHFFRAGKYHDVVLMEKMLEAPVVES